MGPEPARSMGAGEEPKSRKERSTAGWDDPFGLWLRRSLREAFGGVAAEPIPASIVRIIEEAGGGQDRSG